MWPHQQERLGSWDRGDRNLGRKHEVEGKQRRRKTDSGILLDSRQDVQKSEEKSLWKSETIKRNTSQETLKITVSAFKKHYWVIWVRKRKEWAGSCDCTGCLLMRANFRIWAPLQTTTPSPACLWACLCHSHLYPAHGQRLGPTEHYYVSWQDPRPLWHTLFSSSLWLSKSRL